MTTKAKPGTALSDRRRHDDRETVVCDIKTQFAMYSMSPRPMHIYMAIA
jgi:hypothetical protein